MTDIKIYVQGEGAETLAHALHMQLSEVIPRLPTLKAAGQEGAEGRVTRSPDAVAVAALVISIPSAILATWDLAQRLQLPEKLRALRERLSATHNSTRTRLVNVDGRTYDFDRLSAQELADLLIEAAELDRE
ncbi:MAG: hypothetical protein GY731_07240 [Gammaproteobacteria bacterium]|nr:hypothetical protein [Gammaproteobacteria bacterium]